MKTINSDVGSSSGTPESHATDRELLEMAAKAAGYQWDAPREQWWDGSRGVWFAWNPLENDAEALRLAVKLGMEICCDDEATHMAMAYARICGTGEDYCFEPVVDDPCAATRRAIVRAAAAIGKAT